MNLKELACLIYETLKENNIDVVLVGGACVSIYSQNRYQSYDLDFITYESLKSVEKALKKLGFKRSGRCFSHEGSPFLLDFLNPPIAIGHEAIRQFKTLKTAAGSLQLLTPTDCVKDRLSAYFHWDDIQSLEQALLVSKNHTIKPEVLMNWAKAEGFIDKFQKFLNHLKKGGQKGGQTRTF